MPVDNIWDAAIELQRATEKNGTSTPSESTLLFAGNRHSGKTSIMYRFVEKAEAVKPSLALEYIFARKSRGASTLKEICHIWELAGGSLSTHLLEVPINKKSLPALSVVLVVDLSTPEVLCVTLEALLKEVRQKIQFVISSATKHNKGYAPLLPGNSMVSDDHPDKNHLNVFPVPLLIVGMKYDIFEDFEPEKRKAVCRLLRHLAHYNGATLLFVSLRNETLVSKAKAYLNHLAFGSILSKGASTDYNRPLNITFGEDSFEMIDGSNLGNVKSTIALSNCYELLKQKFVEYFPQVEQKTTMPEDPGKDPYFREKDIDIMKAQKERELEEYRKRQGTEKKGRNHPDWD